MMKNASMMFSCQGYQRAFLVLSGGSQAYERASITACCGAGDAAHMDGGDVPKFRAFGSDGTCAIGVCEVIPSS